MLIDPILLILHLLGLASPGILAVATIFWVWVLIDCIMKEPSDTNDKVAWLLFIIFLPYLGALLYYVLRRPARIKTTGR